MGLSGYTGLALAIMLQVPAIVAGDSAVAEVAPAEHPLMPVLRAAHDAHDRVARGVRDYSCLLIKRERVDGRLTPHQTMWADIRHERVNGDRVVVPFSVRLRFALPQSIQGREVLFVQGRNGGKLFARKGGNRFSYVTVQLDPESDAAMRDNRYPITEIGILNLLARLIQAGEDELRRNPEGDQIEVRFYEGSKVDDRACTGVEIVHPVMQPGVGFHLVRVFLDEELQVPVRYEAYDFPQPPGDAPRLLEEYTYLKMRLNVGLSDADFSRVEFGASVP